MPDTHRWQWPWQPGRAAPAPAWQAPPACKPAFLVRQRCELQRLQADPGDGALFHRFGFVPGPGVNMTGRCSGAGAADESGLNVCRPSLWLVAHEPRATGPASCEYAWPGFRLL